MNSAKKTRQYENIVQTICFFSLMEMITDSISIYLSIIFPFAITSILRYFCYHSCNYVTFQDCLLRAAYLLSKTPVKAPALILILTDRDSQQSSSFPDFFQQDQKEKPDEYSGWFISYLFIHFGGGHELTFVSLILVDQQIQYINVTEREMSDYQPKILGFLCNWCCYTAADSAGVGRYQYPPSLRVVRMMCTGRLDPSFPLEGLANGADAVFVGGCHPGECHYIDGNYHALVSAALVHETLERIGISKDRFLIDWASAAEGPNFVKIITRFTQRIAELGPLGQAEGMDEAELRQKLAIATEATRNTKVRTNLISASKEMMKSGDFSRPAIAGLVAAKCDKNLTELIGGRPA